MSTLLGRIQTLFYAQAHRTVDRVEDPELILEQTLREVDLQTARAKRAVINAMASEKLLARQINTFDQQINEWHTRARQAVENGRDDLAKRSLSRKLEIENTKERLQRSWDTARSTVEKMKNQLANLEAKRERMFQKRIALLARQKAAQAQAILNQNISEFDTILIPEEQMDRMEERIAQAEAYASAVTELQEGQTELEKDIDNLEYSNQIELELQALKNTE